MAKRKYEIRVIEEEDARIVVKPKNQKMPWEWIFTMVLAVALLLFVLFYSHHYRVLFPTGYGFVEGIELKGK